MISTFSLAISVNFSDLNSLEFEAIKIFFTSSTISWIKSLGSILFADSDEKKKKLNISYLRK
jgi:hypothetical protein